ncbi:MAG: hypothetical protein AAFV53_19780, partial [Myxococcota bacterium]
AAPPNFDTPQGTLWRLNVPWDSAPMFSGITYGQGPERATQQIPTSGPPPALVDGEQYYLYVQRDVLQPITRCLFTYPSIPPQTSADASGCTTVTANPSRLMFIGIPLLVLSLRRRR